jgi:hypothetical protein
MIDDRDRLEEALARTESDVDSALKAAQALVAQLKRVQKAALTGSTRDLEKALEHALELAGATRDSVAGAKSGWRFETRNYLESGTFTEEILAMAARHSLMAQEEDGRIVSFPSLMRVLPADEAVEIDRKRVREIRPSRLVDRLKQAQTRPPRFRPEPFLNTLYSAYEFVLAQRNRQIGETVRLVDIYDVLTLLPGARTQYSKPEFVRDIYLLDESGVTATRDGTRLSFHAATGAKSASALRAVTRDGQLKTYYGLAFRS